MTLRLRQICLAVPALAPAVDAVRSVFGLEVCHRDEAVAKYGLENALFVFGWQFLEIVAPLTGGTAAGRFIEKSGGRGGYMAIFDTDDPERRREHVLALGIRIAHEMDYPSFRGIQLHPRDGRATMLEFDRSLGNQRLDGAYWPAGPHWQQQQRLDLVGGMPWVEVQGPDPEDLAAHWARIIDAPLARDAAGRPELAFELGGVRFRTGPTEMLATLQVQVADPADVLAAARAAGCTVDDGGFRLGGVRFEPVTLRP